MEVGSHRCALTCYDGLSDPVGELTSVGANKATLEKVVGSISELRRALAYRRDDLSVNLRREAEGLRGLLI